MGGGVPWIALVAADDPHQQERRCRQGHLWRRMGARPPREHLACVLAEGARQRRPSQPLTLGVPGVRRPESGSFVNVLRLPSAILREE